MVDTQVNCGTSLFQRHVFAPHYYGKLRELSQMVEAEDWSCPDYHQLTNLNVLGFMLSKTYELSVAQDLIVQSPDGSVVAFDTRLLHRHTGEPIFAVCRRNSDPNQQPYVFAGWHGPSDSPICNLPAQPRPASTRPCVFDPYKPLQPRTVHITDEHKERFPDGLRQLDETTLQMLVTGAIIRVQNALKRDARLAISGTYRGNCVFYLPLRITDDPSAALALAVTPTDSANLISTALPIAKAYKCARINGCLEGTWLHKSRAALLNRSGVPQHVG